MAFGGKARVILSLELIQSFSIEYSEDGLVLMLLAMMAGLVLYKVASEVFWKSNHSDKFLILRLYYLNLFSV